MMKLLVLIDGSDKSIRAAQYAIRLARSSKEPMEAHLLNIQLPVTFGDIGKFVSKDALNAHYQEEGMKVLKGPRDLFIAEGLPYTIQIRVGPIAESIERYVNDEGCDQIIMGTRGLGAVSSILLGSVATKVIHMSKIPVTLVK